MALSSALIDCMDAWFHIASYMSPKPQSQSAVSDTAHVVALLLVLAELYAHGVRLGLPETQTPRGIKPSVQRCGTASSTNQLPVKQIERKEDSWTTGTISTPCNVKLYLVLLRVHHVFLNGFNLDLASREVFRNDVFHNTVVAVEFVVESELTKAIKTEPFKAIKLKARVSGEATFLPTNLQEVE